jgi:hypothetical protein
VAYDLLRRKRIPLNIALSSSLTTDGVTDEPIPTTDADRSYLASLAVMKMNAEAGNKKAKADWKVALQGIAKIQKRARKGDKNAQRTLAVIRESGLFQGVAAMSVSGADPISSRERKLLAMLANLKLRALQGNPQAKQLTAAIAKLGL